MPESKSFWDHPIEKLEKALDLRKQIATLQQKLSDLFSSGVQGDAVAKPGRKGRRGRRAMSPEARARIAAAQRARWAKQKGTSAATPKLATKAKGRRTMSPEARARIAAAARARWAKVKGGSTAPAKPKAKRNISPEARARMAEAARRRWAKAKG